MVTSGKTEVGTRFGKYRLDRELGRGAAGMVYLAEDTLLVRPVALKILGEGTGRSQAQLERFILEARSASLLAHPNTVPVYEINEVDGRYYIAMEWLEGGSAQEAIERKGAVPWKQAVAWVADACRGLAAAHRAGMLHRDIKPGNILLAQDGRAKLGDFGLVKWTGDSDPMITAIGGPLGTPSFMSPEQCQAEPLDERSDIYSLGATLFALLTGHPPYRSETSFGVMFAHCSSPVPTLEGQADDIPAECNQVIARAMAKNRTDRYPSAAALLADLDALLGHPAPAEAAPAVTVATASAPLARTARVPLPVWVSASLAVAGAIAAVSYFASSRSAPEPAVDVPPVQLAAATIAPAPSPSPADPTAPPAPMPASFPKILQVGQHRGAITDLEFNRAGDQIIAVARGSVLAFWRPDQPNVSRRFVDPQNPKSAPLYALGYFEKRSRAITGGELPELVLWDTVKGTILRRVPHPHHVVRAIDVSPDGRTFSTGGDIGWHYWELTADDQLVDKGKLDDDLVMVRSVRFSTVQTMVAATSENENVRIRSVRNETLRLKLNQGGSEELAVAFGKARLDWAFSDRSGQIFVGPVTPRLPAVGRIDQWKFPAVTLDFAPDRRVLAAAGPGDDTVTLYDLVQKKSYRLPTETKQGINIVAFSPNGKQLAVGDKAGHIQLADLPLDLLPPIESKQELLYDQSANAVYHRSVQQSIEGIRGLFAPKKESAP